MKVSLKDRDIPRNKQGDPHFTQLCDEKLLARLNASEFWPTDLFAVFMPREIVELVNRSLYQMEYQSKSHGKYRQQREDLLRPVKQAFYSLFPQQSFAKATNEQLQLCVEHVRKERETHP